MKKEKPEGGKPSDTPGKDDKNPKQDDTKPQKEEDKKPSEVNGPINTDIPKENSSEDFFKIAAKMSDDLGDSFHKIIDVDILRDLIKQRIKSLKKEVKGQRKFDKRLGTIGEHSVKLTAEEKKVKDLELSTLKTQLFNLREKRKSLSKRFHSHFSNEKAAQEYALLRSKAESTSYVAQNRIMISRKAEKILNDAIQGKYRAEIVELKKKASGTSEDNIREFNIYFRDLLDQIDDEAAIILSGAIKEKLYAAIRSSLNKWNSRSNTIPAIKIPKDSK